MAFFRLWKNDQTVPVQIAVRKCNSLLSWSGSSASMQTKHIKEALQSLLLDFHPNTNQQRVTGFWGESTSLLGETWEKSQSSLLCCIPAACTPTVTCSARSLQVHTDLFLPPLQCVPGEIDSVLAPNRLGLDFSSQAKPYRHIPSCEHTASCKELHKPIPKAQHKFPRWPTVMQHHCTHFTGIEATHPLFLHISNLTAGMIKKLPQWCSFGSTVAFAHLSGWRCES